METKKTKTTSEDDKCVACVAIKIHNIHDLDKAFIVGMMIGVGIEGAGLTPTFCGKHMSLLQVMGTETDVKLKEVSDKPAAEESSVNVVTERSRTS